MKNIIIWTSALLLGAVLGWLGIEWLNNLLDFIATIYTRLFQFVAVPTIALAIITTLSSLGGKKETGRIFLHTISYTLLTTIAAALVGLVLYLIISPENLPADVVATGQTDVPENLGELTYYDHILSIIPNNVIEPFAKGNVLSILLVSAAVGLALAFMLSSGHCRWASWHSLHNSQHKWKLALPSVHWDNMWQSSSVAISSSSS